MKKDVIYKDLGLISYQEALKYQETLMNEIIDIKMQNKKENAEIKSTNNYLLFCQHENVYTLGKSGEEKNLLLNSKELEKSQSTFYKTNRGGDITFHGEGQLVGYPILDLDNFFNDIHKYMRLLEEANIKVCRDYNIDAGRIEGLTGVWIDYKDKINPRKICALGVKASRWVTMHGFALNINTDLSYFDNIIPCGISDKAVTSMEKELGRKIDFKEVSKKLKLHIAELFNMNLI